jgi:uncharacterized protein YndB with AHSA1/START domain
MKIVSFISLLLPLIGAQIGATEDQSTNPTALMDGKVKTNRTIFLKATIHAPPSKVFELWTTADGVRKFFAPDARIDATAGGRYQIIFFPSKDPEGDSHGTKGARILRVVPDNELAFEWVTFAGDNLLGKSAPPYAASAQRNIAPLPTWVEISFDAVTGKPNETQLTFAHYGFREGELWTQSYQWFTRSWKGVLDQLAAYCENQNHI